MGGIVLFAADLFESETINGMVSVFQEVLRQSLEQPQTPIAVLPLTNGLAELRSMGLLETERTEYPRESSVVDIFREQVADCPDATAVTDSSSQLTYAQLDRQSGVPIRVYGVVPKMSLTPGRIWRGIPSIGDAPAPSSRAPRNGRPHVGRAC